MAYIDNINNRMRGSREQRESKRTAKKMQATLQAGPPPDGPIKVRFDARTVITIKAKALPFWQARYPGATIINPITE